MDISIVEGLARLRGRSPKLQAMISIDKYITAYITSNTLLPTKTCILRDVTNRETLANLRAYWFHHRFHVSHPGMTEHDPVLEPTVLGPKNFQSSSQIPQGLHYPTPLGRWFPTRRGYIQPEAADLGFGQGMFLQLIVDPRVRRLLFNLGAQLYRKFLYSL